MSHRRSAHPQCEEEGLKCNPSSSSSDVLIAAEEIVEGLGEGGEPVSPPPAATSTHTTNAQQVPLDMHIERCARCITRDSMCPTNDNFTFSRKLQFVESERKDRSDVTQSPSMRKPWHTRSQLPGILTSTLSQKLTRFGDGTCALAFLTFLPFDKQD